MRGDHRAIQEFRVAEDRHAGGAGRLGRRMRAGKLVRDAGREQQRIRAQAALGGVAQRDTRAGGGAALRLAIVPGLDLGAPFHQPQRRRQPGAAEPDHRDAGAEEGREGRRRRAHRIFSVLRPTRARIMAMIQKRMTMVASAQPFFSK